MEVVRMNSFLRHKKRQRNCLYREQINVRVRSRNLPDICTLNSQKSAASLTSFRKHRIIKHYA